MDIKFFYKDGTSENFNLTGEKYLQSKFSDGKFPTFTVADNDYTKELFNIITRYKEIKDNLTSVKLNFDNFGNIEFSSNNYSLEYVLGFKNVVTEYLKFIYHD